MRLNAGAGRGTSRRQKALPVIRRAQARLEAGLPTLIRLLAIMGVLAGLGYAALWALATKVEPQEREISYTIPQDRIGK